MADDLVMKQLVAVIDNRTTMVCLRAAGQIRPVDKPYETLMGDLDEPPFHVHCRSMSVPWMPGFIGDIKDDANAEIRRRPTKEKKFGPEGYTGSLPPKADTRPSTPKVAPPRTIGPVWTVGKSKNGWTYVTGSKNAAREAADGAPVSKATVTLKHPWDLPAKDGGSVAVFLAEWLADRKGKRSGARERASAIRAEARRRGYDGVVFRDEGDEVTEVLALNKSAVKKD